MQLIFFSYYDLRLVNTERRMESIAGISNPLYAKKKKERAEVYRCMHEQFQEQLYVSLGSCFLGET